MIGILFKLIALTSLWCLALQISTSEGMVFYRLREYAEMKGDKIFEALILCPWCCPSIHSIFGLLAALGLGIINIDWYVLILWPFVIAGSSVTTGLIWQIHKYIEIKNKYYNHLEEHAYFDLKNRKVEHAKNKK